MADFLWVMCALDDDQYNEIEQTFLETVNPKEVSIKQKELIEISKIKPDIILPKYIPAEELPSHMDKELYSNGFIDNKNSIDFDNIFTIDDIDRLFHSLPLNEDNIIELLGYDTPPFAVLAYSVGVEAATSLPGLHGNLLVRYSHLSDTIEKSRHILRNIDNRCWEKARRYISTCSAGSITHQYDEDIQQIFTAIPRGLKAAKKRGANLIALTLWMG